MLARLHCGTESDLIDVAGKRKDLDVDHSAAKKRAKTEATANTGSYNHDAAVQQCEAGEDERSDEGVVAKPIQSFKDFVFNVLFKMLRAALRGGVETSVPVRPFWSVKAVKVQSRFWGSRPFEPIWRYKMAVTRTTARAEYQNNEYSR
jgi:hypothetical protein